MPDEKTRADSLREYLTGASSNGGTQTAPNSSLGHYRSSTEAVCYSISIANAISGITIEYASGGNTVGSGSLYAVSSNALQWKSYGQSYGDAVTIANGETKIIEESGNSGAYVRVTRTSADSLSGTATVTLAMTSNNVYGFDNVSSAEALSGDTEYRATILVNENSSSIENVKRYIGELGTSQTSDSAQLSSSGAGTLGTTGSFSDWPSSGWCHIKSSGGTTREIVYYSSRTNAALTVPSTGRSRLGTSAAVGYSSDTLHSVPGVAIAIDTAGVTTGGSAIQTIADEGTAPTSVTWNVGITSATGLNIGTIASTYQVGFWIKREIPESTQSNSGVITKLAETYDAV